MSEIEQMRQLLDDTDAQHHREQEAFGEGFTVGYESGYEVGYARRCMEEAAHWAALAEKIRDVGRSRHLQYTDLEFDRWGGPREAFGLPRDGDHEGESR